MLRELGKISQQSLAQAIDEQSGKAVLLGELLLKRGLISKADLVPYEGVSEMVRSGAAPVGIRRGAQANGMRSLQQDALLKVNLGLTSLEEVMRVISLKDAGTRGHFNVRHRPA